MKVQTLSKLVILAIFVLVVATQAFAIEPELISHTPMVVEDREYFTSEFERSYMVVYGEKEFYISGTLGPLKLGKYNRAEKEAWLHATAVAEFGDYVASPQRGYKALWINYDKERVGAFLYRLLDDGITLYVAQVFMRPEFQRKGIASFVLNHLIPSLHPERTAYEVIARPQNDGARAYYPRCGFHRGDEEVVLKYNYDPSRYISFVKRNDG